MITDLSIPLVLKLVPKTSKTRYIGGYCALNLHPVPEDTSGDWHPADYLCCRADQPTLELGVFGEEAGPNRNTNHIFGDYGIIESAEDFKKWGYSPVYTEVYRSNHFRAILDMLYIDLMTRPIAGPPPMPYSEQGATFDFLDTEEQKRELLDKALLIGPHLPPERRPFLDEWIAREEIYEEQRYKSICAVGSS